MTRLEALNEAEESPHGVRRALGVDRVNRRRYVSYRDHNREWTEESRNGSWENTHLDPPGVDWIPAYDGASQLLD
jgi:hypothetical protein